MKKQILTLSAAAFMAALTCQTAFALDHDVVILHTNDTHCGIEENMGYAGLVWYENQMKEETPYVTLGGCRGRHPGRAGGDPVRGRVPGADHE